MSPTPTPPTPTNFTKIADIPYDVNDDDGAPDPLRSLDLYIPNSLSLNPSSSTASSPEQERPAREVVLLVYVHGGAWRSEDKSDHAALGAHWVQAFQDLHSLSNSVDVVVAIPNYRLSPRIKHPTHAQDTQNALSYLLSSPPPPSAPFTYSRVWLVGHSAGAHILSAILLLPPISPSSPLARKEPASKELLERITGVVLAEGIYDVDLLLKNFPSDYYRGFVEQAFLVRSESSLPPPSSLPAPSLAPENTTPSEVKEDAFSKRYGPTNAEGGRGPYADVDLTNYTLPPGGEVVHVQWVIVHSAEDDLVDMAQAEVMYERLVELGLGGEKGKDGKDGGEGRVSRKTVSGGHYEVPNSEELLAILKRVIFGSG